MEKASQRENRATLTQSECATRARRKSRGVKLNILKGVLRLFEDFKGELSTLGDQGDAYIPARTVLYRDH